MVGWKRRKEPAPSEGMGARNTVSALEPRSYYYRGSGDHQTPQFNNSPKENPSGYKPEKTHSI